MRLAETVKLRVALQIVPIPNQMTCPSLSMLTVLPGDLPKKNTTFRHPPIGRRAMRIKKKMIDGHLLLRRPALMDDVHGLMFHTRAIALVE
jgi:hypothetical protein